MKLAPLTEVEAAALLGLDEAGQRRLAVYLATLERWQRRINLVGPATLTDPWRRHILDSAQLMPYLPPGPPSIADLGSGAGLPGMVLAMLTASPVTLIESDARKCAFLVEASRATGTPVHIVNQRIEAMTGDARHATFAVVTARALAPLDRLIGLAQPFLKPDGCLLLLKGHRFSDELIQAQDRWKMRVATYASRSQPGGVVARIDMIERIR